MRKLLVPLFAALCGTTVAHADVASERVMLRSTGATCPNGAGYAFIRVLQTPDGKAQQVTGPIVPAGYYLDITDVTYQPDTVATTWRGSFSLRIQNVADPRFSTTFLEDQVVGDEATRNIQLATGQLLGSGGRLCWSSSWGISQPTLLSGAMVIVRGKLISAGGQVSLPPQLPANP